MRRFQKTKNIMRHTLANKVIFREIRFLNVTTNRYIVLRIGNSTTVYASDASDTPNLVFGLIYHTITMIDDEKPSSSCLFRVLPDPTLLHISK